MSNIIDLTSDSEPESKVIEFSPANTWASDTYNLQKIEFYHEMSNLLNWISYQWALILVLKKLNQRSEIFSIESTLGISMRSITELNKIQRQQTEVVTAIIKVLNYMKLRPYNGPACTIRDMLGINLKNMEQKYMWSKPEALETATLVYFIEKDYDYIGRVSARHYNPCNLLEVGKKYVPEDDEIEEYALVNNIRVESINIHSYKEWEIDNTQKLLNIIKEYKYKTIRLYSPRISEVATLYIISRITDRTTHYQATKKMEIYYIKKEYITKKEEFERNINDWKKWELIVKAAEQENKEKTKKEIKQKLIKDKIRIIGVSDKVQDEIDLELLYFLSRGAKYAPHKWIEKEERIKEKVDNIMIRFELDEKQ
ncbi:hypothetical protein RFI_30301 [Reticulomyxa filosa]|uniref:Uncharacterized protein n=1 Tax=Reticulomyxa filosa TaxID=46433 RepID=X6M276_RETFI|nr:hypothetical protein RFI_30301 [Reticulomyxa filosa]|eukprot:ETO07090.1 hypothetical protein RFI_30301 [Reticulomyxa filosa]